MIYWIANEVIISRDEQFEWLQGLNRYFDADWDEFLIAAAAAGRELIFVCTKVRQLSENHLHLFHRFKYSKGSWQRTFAL